jgi:hypothetical protein
VNNVRFCGNSSGYRLMRPAKLGDRSTLSTKLDGLAPLTVPLLLKPHLPKDRFKYKKNKHPFSSNRNVLMGQ